MILTRKIWEFCQVVPPLLVDLNNLSCPGLSLGREALLICTLNHIFDICGMNGVKYCEKVLSIWQSVLRVCILKELHHLSVALELGVDVLNRELIIFWNIDELASSLWQQ